MNLQNRTLLFVGLLAYLVLGILAWHFALYRIIYTDSAFQLVNIINDQKFNIGTRYGAVFTQVFALVGVKLHLKLRELITFYSIGFIIIQVVVFTACLKLFKQPKFAIAMLLFSLNMAGYTFFWVQAELPQSINLLIFSFAFIFYRKNSPELSLWEFPLLLAFAFLLVYFHPLVIFPFGFCIVFFFLNESSLQVRKRIVLLAIFFLAIILLKAFVFPISQYDHGSMGRIKNIYRQFPYFFNIASNYYFVQRCLHNYVMYPLATLVITILLAVRKRWLQLLFFWTCFLGYLFIINVSFYQAEYPQYLENMYHPLTVMLVFTLLFSAFKNQVTPLWLYGIIPIILLIRIADVCTTSNHYEARLDKYASFLAKTAKCKNKKLLVRETNLPMDTMEVTWASAQEILLLSAINSPDSARAVFYKNDSIALPYSSDIRNAVFTKWYPIPYQNLNHDYFRMQDYTFYSEVPETIECK